ncbi:MAG: hypothetical protein AAB209_05820 [Bacteroidota bacterium]
MKKILLWCCAFSMLFSMGCATRYFRYTTNLNTSGTWHIDQTGAFSSTSFISGTLDVPDDADILEVTIESLTLTPRVLAGHTASSVQAAANVTYPIFAGIGEETAPLFPSQTLSLGNGQSPPNALIQQGIERLKKLVIDFIRKGGFPPRTRVTLEGTVQGGRAVLEIDYSINASIKYGRCQEVLNSMSGGEECPEHGLGTGGPL